MKNVLQTCVPRKSIIQGTFNPEIFTAALGPVINYYRQGDNSLDSVYTNAEIFFNEATYVTDGMKSIINNAFQRINGDPSVPSIQRLETGFGGGKTHTLIACVHIANRGKEIASSVKEIIDEQYLPEAGSVKVVGIAGDEISMSKTVSGNVIPYTIWGEIALQIGGKELYQKVRNFAESYAAPGKDYFDIVFGNHKVLIMFDELAQYASRLETYNGTSDQLAAFLMALNGHVRRNAGIALIVTLAGSSDAFAKETEKLSDVLNKMSDKLLSQDDVISIASKADRNIKSVVMRDASTFTPVQASEISAVLSKRLFENIDYDAVHEVVEEYVQIYEKNKNMLPQEATNINFKDRLISHYPFHPTLIDFLNNKLALAKNFQGTRGVLRTLAMMIRSIWNSNKNVFMIHVSDIDMRNGGIVDEILGKTDCGDLKTVLTSDIGSIDTSSSIKGGKSNAQIEDEKNPHPDKVAMYEDTWKVVFLNSLVGRSDGFMSNVFGVAEQDAIFQISNPVLTPSQVRVALEKIQDSAYYLRCENGKYFAHVDPTINSVLARIRETITRKQIMEKLRGVVNSMIQSNDAFVIEHNVSSYEHVPDNYEKPIIAVIGIDVPKVDVNEYYTYTTNGLYRMRKNLLTLLIPKTTEILGLQGDMPVNSFLFEECDTDKNEVQKYYARVEDLVKQVLALNILDKNPEQYGISPTKLQDADFRDRIMSRPQELSVAVAGLYSRFCYWSVQGLVRRDIKTVNGSSGETIVTLIQNKLIEDGELISNKGIKFGAGLLRELSQNYFFKKLKVDKCSELLIHFYNNGTWPMLSDKRILGSIIREGVECGLWIVYKDWDNLTDKRPTEMYCSDKVVPLNIDLLSNSNKNDYKITTVEFAKKNGWLEQDKPTDSQVKDVIMDVLKVDGVVSFSGLKEQVANSLPKADSAQVEDIVRDMAVNDRYMIYQGELEQSDRPDEDNCFVSFNAANHDIADDDIIITPKTVVERGWNMAQSNSISLSAGRGNDAVKGVVKLLGDLGSMYRRKKAVSEVSSIDVYDMKLPGGGRMRITLDHAGAIDFTKLDEFFRDFVQKLSVDSLTGVEISIDEPVKDCELVKELNDLKE